MEENNQAIANETAMKKPKCRHLTVIIILAILFVGSLGFGIFELILNLQKTDKDCKVAAGSSQNSSETKTEKKSSGTAKAAPVINDQGGSVAINIEVDYDIVEVKKCSDSACMDGAGYYNFTLGDGLYARYSDGKIVSYYSDDGSFSGVVFDKKIEKNFKLDGKLKQALVGRFGNGGEDAIILLTNDGKLATIHLNKTANDIVITKNLGNFSNIVSLHHGIEGNGSEVFAVDANGKAHALYETFHQE